MSSCGSSEKGFTSRPANAEDAGGIIELLHALYQENADFRTSFRAKEANLAEQLAAGTTLCAVAVESNQDPASPNPATGRIVGVMTYWETYSTWLGRPGIRIEDVFVDPSRRGEGVGASLLHVVLEDAAQRRVARIEWYIPGKEVPQMLELSQGINAVPHNEWVLCALEDEALLDMASDESNNVEGFTTREATPDDADLIYRYVVKLAAHHDVTEEELTSTPERLRAHLEEGLFMCLLAIEEGTGEAKGIALHFRDFSSYRARPGLHLEDLYVDQDARGKGLGKLLIAAICRRAIAMKSLRVEWVVEDTNKGAIKFYESIGTHIKPDLVNMRLPVAARAALIEQLQRKYGD